MASRASRAAAPQYVKDQREYRRKNKKAVKAAEIERWKLNGGGKPKVIKSQSRNRLMTPEEYEQAFGRPMPEELRSAPTPKPDYEQYMSSSDWVIRRNRYFETHPRRCTACYWPDEHVYLHHLTYEHLGDEPDEDLMPLCARCHTRVHNFAKTSTLSLRDATWAKVKAIQYDVQRRRKRRQQQAKVG